MVRQTIAAGLAPEGSTTSHGPVAGLGATRAVPTSSRGVASAVRPSFTGTPVSRRKSVESAGSSNEVNCRVRRRAPAAAGAAAEVPEKSVNRPPPDVGASQRTPGARSESAGPPLLVHGTTSGPVYGSMHSASPSQAWAPCPAA